jgi:hypothetical protein
MCVLRSLRNSSWLHCLKTLPFTREWQRQESPCSMCMHQAKHARHVCIYACTYIYIYIYICVCVCICIYKCTLTLYLCIYITLYIYIYIRICIFECPLDLTNTSPQHVCMHACVYACMHNRIYLRVCVKTFALLQKNLCHNQLLCLSHLRLGYALTHKMKPFARVYACVCAKVFFASQSSF